MGSAAPYAPPVTITATPPLWTSSEVSLTGLLCLVSEISSLAYGDQSRIKFSFSLPYAVPKSDALLTCFNTPNMQLNASEVAVTQGWSVESNGAETAMSVDRLPSVHTLTIPDALSNDPYFAGSYRQQRYDDFKLADEALLHLVSWNGAADTEPAADNCVMLSAEWSANRRYTLELSYNNPPVPHPSSTPQSEQLQLWIAPLSGESSPLGGDAEWADEVSWSFAIRGHKYGTVCGSDAGPGSSTTLRSGAGPFPAFVANDAETQVQTFAFDADNRGRRTTEGRSALAQRLCDTYSEEKAKLEAGTMSDQLVPGAMWRAFRQDSTALVDWQLIHQTNVSLYPRALDGRRPGVPTREHGIGSRCASMKGACDKDSGRLIDVRTTGARKYEDNIPKAQTILDLLGHVGGTFDPSLADRRYRSLYTFGLIGEVLRNSAARYECDGLLLDGADGTEPFYIGNERGGAWPGDVSEL